MKHPRQTLKPPEPGRAPARGFTLIELLVSMSVIALLAAIVMPVALRARALARNSQCVSNLGQIGKAINIYVEFNDNWYPCASIMPSTEPEPGLPRICDLLVRYASFDVFECGDDKPTDPAYTHRSYFVGEGSSYEWAEIFNHLKPGMTVAFVPFKIENVPLLRDYEPFHKRGSRIGTNGLFTDNHVESF